MVRTQIVPQYSVLCRLELQSLTLLNILLFTRFRHFLVFLKEKFLCFDLKSQHSTDQHEP
jgi:hypothetical protein